MSDVFTKTELQMRLETLKISTKSINTLSMWLIKHSIHFKAIVRIWFKKLVEASKHKKLTFMYLADDVLQKSRKQYPEFVIEFGHQMEKVLQHLATVNLDGKNNCKVVKLIKTWREWKLFEEKRQINLENIWKEGMTFWLCDEENSLKRRETIPNHESPPLKQLKKDDVKSQNSNQFSREMTLPPHLTCTECNDLLNEPVQLPCCGTSVCRLCAARKLAQHKGCWFAFCPKTSSGYGTTMSVDQCIICPALFSQIAFWKTQSNNKWYQELEDEKPVKNEDNMEYIEAESVVKSDIVGLFKKVGLSQVEREGKTLSETKITPATRGEEIKITSATRGEKTKTSSATLGEKIKTSSATRGEEIKTSSATSEKIKISSATTGEEIKISSATSTRGEEIKITAATTGVEIKTSLGTTGEEIKTSSATKAAVIPPITPITALVNSLVKKTFQQKIIGRGPPTITTVKETFGGVRLTPSIIEKISDVKLVGPLQVNIEEPTQLYSGSFGQQEPTNEDNCEFQNLEYIQSLSASVPGVNQTSYNMYHDQGAACDGYQWVDHERSKRYWEESVDIFLKEKGGYEESEQNRIDGQGRRSDAQDRKQRTEEAERKEEKRISVLRLLISKKLLISSLEKEKEALEEKFGGQGKELEDVKGKYMASQKEIKLFEKEIKEKNLENNILSEASAKLKDENKALHQFRIVQKQKIDQLQKEKGNLEEKVDGLGGELEDIKGKYMASQKETKQFEKEIKEKDLENNRLSVASVITKTDFEKIIEEQGKELEDIKDKYMTSWKQTKQLEKEIQDQSLENNTISEASAKLKEEKKSLHQFRIDQKQRIDKLQKEKGDLEEKVCGLGEELEDIEGKYMASLKEVKQFEKEIKEKDKELEDINDKYMASWKQTKHLEKEIQDNKLENNILSVAAAKLKEEKKALHQFRIDQKQRIDQLQQEKNEARSFFEIAFAKHCQEITATIGKSRTEGEINKKELLEAKNKISEDKITLDLAMKELKEEMIKLKEENIKLKSYYQGQFKAQEAKSLIAQSPFEIENMTTALDEIRPEREAKVMIKIVESENKELQSKVSTIYDINSNIFSHNLGEPLDSEILKRMHSPSNLDEEDMNWKRPKVCEIIEEEIKITPATRGEESKTSSATREQNKTSSATRGEEIKITSANRGEEIKTSLATREEIKTSSATRGKDIKTSSVTRREEIENSYATRGEEINITSATKGEENKTSLGTREEIKTSSATEIAVIPPISQKKTFRQQIIVRGPAPITRSRYRSDQPGQPGQQQQQVIQKVVIHQPGTSPRQPQSDQQITLPLKELPVKTDEEQDIGRGKKQANPKKQIIMNKAKDTGTLKQPNIRKIDFSRFLSSTVNPSIPKAHSKSKSSL